MDGPMSSGVVTCALYGDGRRVADVPFDNCGLQDCAEGQLLWIGLYEPEEELLRIAQQHFGLHDLAIEDAHNAHQRPKVELFGESLFLVLRTAQLQNGQIAYGETHLFVGKGYLISVRHGASLSYLDVRNRLERKPEMLKLGVQAALHAVVDFVADNFFPVIDDIARELADIESHVLDETLDVAVIGRIYHLRQ